MTAFYNEIAPYPAAWLKNLSRENLIAPGHVEECSVEEVHPIDLYGYTQAHFFAGLGAWSYALRLAGWPDDRPIWTASLPCQPFSNARRGKGFDDERHLWPVFFGLVRECRPPVIIGEQVAAPAGLAWFDVVSSDLEGEGYAVGAADLCAASVGAPHIRPRLYFAATRVGHADPPRLPLGQKPAVRRGAVRQKGKTARPASPWDEVEWLLGEDGYRPAQPGLHPLAHGAAARMGRMRAIGNSLVPQVAATFIEALMSVLD